MTPFNKNQIPASITTTEALAVWLAEIHQYNYPEILCVEYLDNDNLPIRRRVVEANQFYFTAPQPAEWRYASRQSIKLKPQFKTSGRVWDHVEVIGNEEIPYAMTAAGLAA